MKKPDKKQLKSTPIYRADGRPVGHVEGGVYRRAMRSTVHQLKKPRAWAADVDTLDQAQTAGASSVEVFDRDTGATYRVELVEFYRHGVRVNRGHGQQLALPLSYWQVTGGRGPARPQSAAGGPSQLRMF